MIVAGIGRDGPPLKITSSSISLVDDRTMNSSSPPSLDLHDRHPIGTPGNASRTHSPNTATSVATQFNPNRDRFMPFHISHRLNRLSPASESLNVNNDEERSRRSQEWVPGSSMRHCSHCNTIAYVSGNASRKLVSLEKCYGESPKSIDPSCPFTCLGPKPKYRLSRLHNALDQGVVACLQSYVCSSSSWVCLVYR